MPDATEPLLVLDQLAFPRGMLETLRDAGYTVDLRFVAPEDSHRKRQGRWVILVAPEEVEEARGDLLELGTDPRVFDVSVPSYDWRPALAVAVLVAVFAVVLALAAVAGKLAMVTTPLSAATCSGRASMGAVASDVAGRSPARSEPTPPWWVRA